MNIKKRVAAAILVFLCFHARQSCFAAPVFSDLTADNPRYPSAAFTVDYGFLTVNGDGAFSPDGFVSRFEAAKVFAGIAGFVEPEGGDAQKNRALINVYAKKYKKWDASADGAIAFLMEKGVLKTDDLKSFVGLKDSIEGVYALTNQDAAMLLVKAAGLENKVSAETRRFLYSDDEKISAQNKPYVYFLKQSGVAFCGIGDFFEPQKAVTRQNFAELLYAFCVGFDVEIKAGSNFNSSSEPEPAAKNATEAAEKSADGQTPEKPAEGGAGGIILNCETSSPKTRFLTGFIISKSHNGFLLLDTNKKTVEIVNVDVSEKTVVSNGENGETLGFLSLPEKIKVYVYLDDALQTALFVTVL